MIRSIVALCVAALLVVLPGSGAAPPAGAQSPDVLVIAQGVDMTLKDRPNIIQ